MATDLGNISLSNATTYSVIDSASYKKSSSVPGTLAWTSGSDDYQQRAGQSIRNQTTSIFVDPNLDKKDSANIASNAVKITTIDNVEKTLTDRWGNLMLEYSDSSADNWISKSIDKSEKYLMAVYDNTESRNIVSSYLLILRNGHERLSEDTIKTQVQRLLKNYLKSHRSAQDRLVFLRSLRNIGLSPSAA